MYLHVGVNDRIVKSKRKNADVIFCESSLLLQIIKN